MKQYTAVSAIVRHNNHILMIQQADKEGLYWYIPGGVVEPGEMIQAAMQREVLEETGLHIPQTGTLACITHTVAPYEARRTTAFFFDVTLDSVDNSQIAPDDPDDLIHDAAFVPLDDAIQRLERVLWDSMRDPLREYLRDNVSAGTLWEYRQTSYRDFEQISSRPNLQ